MSRSKLELHDFAEYTILSQLTYSPDGRLAAFVAQKAKVDMEGYAADLYVMSAAGDDVRRLTSAGDCRGFFWVSDTEIAFPAMRDSKDRERAKKGEPLTVYQKIAVDGGEAQEMLRLPVKVSSAKVMGDGRWAVTARTQTA